VIESWTTELALSIPEDLISFWSQTGGGGCFESETFFRPTSVRTNEPSFIEGDDFETANEFHLKKGMPAEYRAFHKGLYFSAIRIADSAYATLDENYEETGVYSDLNQWYQRTLRAEFGARYGLLNTE
jgi:hypothetical protein